MQKVTNSRQFIAIINHFQLRFRNFKVIFTGGYASTIINKKTKFIYREDLTLLGTSFYQNFLNEKH